MIYIDLSFSAPSSPTIAGVEISTQSMDLAIRLVNAWVAGYGYDVERASPEIDRIAKTKSRGITYTKLEDLR